MKFKCKGIDFKVSFPAVAFFALAIICDIKGMMPVCLFSSMLHEFGHFAFMKIHGVKIKSVEFNTGDVAINADLSAVSYKAEILINAGGVAVNFILAIFGLLFYEITSLNFFQSIFISNLLIGVFNILPVRYLDGGQIFLILLQKRFNQKISERILNIFTLVLIVPVGVFGLIFLFNSSYNFSLLFAVLYLICTLVSKEFKDVS